MVIARSFVQSSVVSRRVYFPVHSFRQVALLYVCHLLICHQSFTKNYSMALRQSIMLIDRYYLCSFMSTILLS